MPEPQSQPNQEKPKRKRGRPEGDRFFPTDEMRRLVTVMAGMGIPEEQMCLAILNPERNHTIDAKTLRKYFRAELDKGFVTANATVGASLFKNATTPTDTYPGGIPVAQLFWLKCRARWQQNPERNIPPPPPASEQENVRETARQICFLLAEEDKQKKREAAPKVIPGKKKKLKISA